MTFTEAALEVLRLAGKPLHYKKITEIAIEKNLLSHVGKTPEITMSSRLATMVKKDRGDAPIIKVKPGVFGLRDFPEDVLESVDGDGSVEVDANDEASEVESAEESSAEAEAANAPPAEPRVPSRPLPGADVFPEEDDDDEPILANLDDESREKDDEGRARRKRRRRRRGGRREDEEGAAEGEEERPVRGNGGRRDAGRGREGRNGRQGTGGGRRGRDITGNWEREAVETDAVGRDLADAIEGALRGADGRARQALPLAKVAEHLVRGGRLGGDPTSLAPTLAASIRSDSARRTQQALRARFRFTDEGVTLTDWALPPEAVAAEKDATRAAARQRQQVHRAFVRKLADLPAAGLMELLATWLNAEGVVALRAVRRSGASSGDFHLAGTLRRGPEEVPIAILVCRDGQVGRERVVDVRGALHHYGNAREAWVVSLGTVLSGAREEAATSGAAPCALFDGAALAEAMEARGIGLVRYTLPLVDLDVELLENLRGPGHVRSRGRDDGRASGEVSSQGEQAPKADEEPTEDDAAPAERGRRRRRRGRRGGERDAAEASTKAQDAEGESEDDELVATAEGDVVEDTDGEPSPEERGEAEAADENDEGEEEAEDIVTPGGDDDEDDEDEILVTGDEDEDDDGDDVADDDDEDDEDVGADDEDDEDEGDAFEDDDEDDDEDDEDDDRT